MTHDNRRASSAVLALTSAADHPDTSLLAGRRAVTVRRVFPGNPDQIARVREFIRLVVGPVPVLDEAVLLASELSTNAVVHTASGARGTFDVTVCRSSSSVRVVVCDSGSRGAPMARRQDDLAEEGRGLSLVDLVADQWGHSGDQDGRSVFFELRW